MKIFLILFLSLSLYSSSKPLEKVSLQLQWLDQFQFAGYYMAKEKGFYKDVGLDVELKKFTYDTNTIEDIIEGKSTFGIGRSSLIQAYSNQKPIKLLSAIFQSSPHILIALKSSNIKTVSDFKDKTLMLTKNTIETASVHAMIKSKLVDEKSMTFKKHTFNLDELIDKKVDLYTAYISNEPYALRAKHIEYNTFSPKDYGFDFYSDILFTSQDEIEENPLRVKAFKAASLKGWKYAFDNIAESVDLIYEKYNSQNKTKQALFFEAYELKKLAYSNNMKLGEISKEKVQRILDIYKIIGNHLGNQNIDDLIFNDTNIYFTKEEKEYLKKKKTITYCVDPDSLPYSAVENNKFIGIGAAVVEMAQNNVGIPFELINTSSWSESVKYAISKKCDILPVAVKTPSREKYFNFTSPYYDEPLVIVTKKSSNYILNIESVINNEFSIKKDNSYAESIQKKYPTIKLHYVNSIEEGLSGVENGKYYAHIDIMMSAAYTLQKLSKINLKISGQFKDKAEASFAIRKDDLMLHQIMQKIAKHTDIQSMQNILNKWVSVNYTQNVEFKYLWEIIATILIIIIIFLYRQNLLNKKNAELKILQDKLLELNKSLETRVVDSVKEIQQKDEYLLQQSKLAQMGEMMSMIAHQWKQPLGSISALQISMLLAIELEDYDLNDKEQQQQFLAFLELKLKKIGSYNQNLSEIISDFSDFYRPDKRAILININSVIKKATRLIETSLEENKINISLDLNSDTDIKLYENEFIQVVLNIINNAKEQLIHNNIQYPSINIKTYEEFDSIILEIYDNAGGISNEILDRIFEPYFSTKLEKNGTGLGLHMSKNIIEQHHSGKIYAKNYKDGALFTIALSVDGNK